MMITKKIVLGLSLTLSFNLLNAAEISGKRVVAEYQGTRTTKELNPCKDCLIKNIRPNTSVEKLTPFNPTKKKTVKAASHHATHPIFRIGLNFTAATVSDAPQTVVIPTNATGSIGNKQFVLMSYQAVISFDRNTGLPDGVLQTDAASFFNGSAGDVRIEYDRFSRRWFAAAEIGNSLVLAVSSGSVITDSTRWSFFTFPNSQIIPQISPVGSGFLDYEQLAIDQKAVYISVNTFDSSFNFIGTSTLVIKKSSLFKENPAVTVFSGIVPESLDLGEFVPPADNFDECAQFGYLAHVSTAGFSSGNIYNKIYFYRIVNPGSDLPTLVGPIAVDVPNYSDPSNAPHLGNLYEERGFLQTGIFGGLMAPHVRNNQLYACHPILIDSSGAANPAGDRVGVRWYQFDLTGDPNGWGEGSEHVDTPPVLVQSGTLFDNTPNNPFFFYIPSIMTNKRHELIISATVSGQNNLTNVVYAARRPGDPKGTLRNPIFLTNNVTNVYNFGPLLNPFNGNIGQRWGDESSLSPDPIHDLDIWSTGQFAAVLNGWGIQVTQLKALRN